MRVRLFIEHRWVSFFFAFKVKWGNLEWKLDFDTYKVGVRDFQPMEKSALVYLPIPSHKASLTVFVWEQEAEECAPFQVTPHSELSHLTFTFHVTCSTDTGYSKNI